MKVVDTKDFCIPSDENDYDELVAFANTMASIQQFDAVPMSVIEDIKAEIEHARNQFIAASGMYQALNMALNIIDKYRGGE